MTWPDAADAGRESPESGAIDRPVSPSRDEAAFSADYDLARDFLAGAGWAQQELVRRFAPLAYSACGRSGLSAEDAEDVCQDAFIDVLRSLPTYRGQSRLSTWMFTLVGRRIADAFRSRYRRIPAAGAQEDEAVVERVAAPPAREDPETRAIQASSDARLWREVEALEHPVRFILVAYYLGEQPVAQIAATLRMPPATVKTHLHRGRKALRERLRNHVDLR